MTYRGVARLVRTSPETVRKYVEDITGRPHPATLQKFADLFFAHYPAGVVRERPAERTPRQLRTVLPPGPDAASAVVEKIFELAGRHPAELPPRTEELRTWLLSVVHTEYDAVKRYPSLRKRRAKRRK